MFDQSIIDKNVFSIFFGSSSDTSYIYFGGYDQLKMTGNVSWIAIEDTGYWDLKGTNF